MGIQGVMVALNKTCGNLLAAAGVPVRQVATAPNLELDKAVRGAAVTSPERRSYMVVVAADRGLLVYHPALGEMAVAMLLLVVLPRQVQPTGGAVAVPLSAAPRAQVDQAL